MGISSAYPNRPNNARLRSEQIYVALIEYQRSFIRYSSIIRMLADGMPCYRLPLAELRAGSLWRSRSAAAPHIDVDLTDAERITSAFTGGWARLPRHRSRAQ